MINVHMTEAENNTDELLTRASIYRVPGISTLYLPSAGELCSHVRNNHPAGQRGPAQGLGKLNPGGARGPACCSAPSPAPSFRAALSQLRVTGTMEMETEVSEAIYQAHWEFN